MLVLGWLIHNQTVRSILNQRIISKLMGWFLSKKIILLLLNLKIVDEPSPCGERYLMYCEWVGSAGIGHLRSNLHSNMRDAFRLGRVCVITKTPNLSKIHNHNVSLRSPWTKYIDFEKTLFPKGFQYVFDETFIQTQSFALREILVIQATHQVTEAENTKYRLIIRDLRHCQLYRITVPWINQQSSMKIRFCPSKIVMNEAEIVLKQLPSEFVALHIRRGDMLNNAGVVEENTSEKILELLHRRNPTKLPVFLMTDEWDRNFYSALAKEFTIYRYDNFANLVQVHNLEDNYLLYQIERIIASKAKFSFANRSHRGIVLGM